MEKKERIVYSDAVNDGVSEWRYLTLPERVSAAHTKALQDNPTGFRALPLGIKMSYNWAFAYAFNSRTLVFTRPIDADAGHPGLTCEASGVTRRALLTAVEAGAIERMFPVIRRHKPSEEESPRPHKGK